MADRISKGGGEQCSRCKQDIPPDDIAALVWGHWLCEACWKLWGKLRTKLVAEALERFVASTPDHHYPEAQVELLHSWLGAYGDEAAHVHETVAEAVIRLLEKRNA